jgi:hypothetical protein
VTVEHVTVTVEVTVMGTVEDQNRGKEGRVQSASLKINIP